MDQPGKFIERLNIRTFPSQPPLNPISRDIGVYFTPRAWSFTTHAIDPDVDEAREALTEDLITSQSVRAVGYVRGMGEASADRPHRNLMNAPYWTDAAAQSASPHEAPRARDARSGAAPWCSAPRAAAARQGGDRRRRIDVTRS